MGTTRFGCLPPRLDGEQTKSGFLPANLDSAKEVWILRAKSGFDFWELVGGGGELGASRRTTRWT
jgi:hypothetical protein